MGWNCSCCWHLPQPSHALPRKGFKMTRATHTAAPWQADRNGTIYAIAPDGTRHVVAAVSPDNQQADCALISAAPELLAVLQAAVNKGYMWDCDPELWGTANALIAKAKG